jgi:SpoVK/Ycf46/Vps4 family AAA+-type ATPase
MGRRKQKPDWTGLLRDVLRGLMRLLWFLANGTYGLVRWICGQAPAIGRQCAFLLSASGKKAGFGRQRKQTRKDRNMSVLMLRQRLLEDMIGVFPFDKSMNMRRLDRITRQMSPAQLVTVCVKAAELVGTDAVGSPPIDEAAIVLAQRNLNRADETNESSQQDGQADYPAKDSGIGCSIESPSGSTSPCRDDFAFLGEQFRREVERLTPEGMGYGSLQDEAHVKERLKLRTAIEQFGYLLPPEDRHRFTDAINKADDESLGIVKDELLSQLASKSFDRHVEEIVASMDDLAPNLHYKLERKAKRRLLPTPAYHFSPKQLVVDITRLKLSIEEYYQSTNSNDDSQRDVVRNPEDMVLDICPVDYDDVAGFGELKREIAYAIEAPLRDFEIIQRATGRPPENTGILLYGPPGCGKSFMALAAAGEFKQRYNATVISVPLEAIHGLHWSKQVPRIVHIFDLARRNAPCIVLWDEFDTYAADPRVTGRKYDEKLCTTFKQQFEGMIKCDQPIVHIATSNYPWKLEIPLLRPGRLGRVFYVPPPDDAARRDIIDMLLAGANVDPHLDTDELVERTQGAVISEIKSVVRDATEKPVREYVTRGRTGGLRETLMSDFRDVLDERSFSQFQAWRDLAVQEILKPRFCPLRHLFADVANMSETKHQSRS